MSCLSVFRLLCSERRVPTAPDSDPACEPRIKQLLLPARLFLQGFMTHAYLIRHHLTKHLSAEGQKSTYEIFSCILLIIIIMSTRCINNN
jgi:hypothetical protein